MSKESKPQSRNATLGDYLNIVKNGAPPDTQVLDKVHNLYKQLGNSSKDKIIRNLYDSFSAILSTLGYKTGDVAELTPHRAAYGYLELLNGVQEYEDIEWRFFDIDPSAAQLVSVSDIPFTSFCEHHLLPFWGKASIVYLPKRKVIGLDKIPKLVNAVAHNLQIQERMTNQIADILHEKLDPQGLGVVIKATHMCVSARGVKSNCNTQTMALRGTFKSDSSYIKYLSSHKYE
ncbi:hypothetical protein COT52_00995 [candidate division WWE3 bacterium CG08_land_8_20_14_0_20_43_13]|uniref:GTP cyclohydrolase I n=2 Tax=Bacteria candidate phyla TaxID=1783234 RepID=A0A2H0X7R7_UNCKA|nr:MAG: hypothetical protein COT52_00995 [candidate division WWE3 bacterium CG08_land_8_20_14_0_20_43_13]PJE73242.1 MAG: hypothetical protein COV00_00880 [Candidatus Tagabacteria bacterium CG10_big_fil_rev_8_21_14_0_10_40_13]